MLGSPVGTHLLCPGSAGMHYVPGWLLRVVPSASGVVIAETIDSRVPDGCEPLYEEGFAEGDPDIVDDQITAKLSRRVHSIFGTVQGRW